MLFIEMLDGNNGDARRAAANLSEARGGHCCDARGLLSLVLG